MAYVVFFSNPLSKNWPLMRSDSISWKVLLAIFAGFLSILHLITAGDNEEKDSKTVEAIMVITKKYNNR